MDLETRLHLGIRTFVDGWDLKEHVILLVEVLVVDGVATSRNQRQYLCAVPRITARKLHPAQLV